MRIAVFFVLLLSLLSELAFVFFAPLLVPYAVPAVLDTGVVGPGVLDTGVVGPDVLFGTVGLKVPFDDIIIDFGLGRVFFCQRSTLLFVWKMENLVLIYNFSYAATMKDKCTAW